MSIEIEIENYRLQFQEQHLAKPACCQVCKRPCRLRWHGSYSRTLITAGKTYTLLIRRLFCILCGHMFGLLPDFVMKFHRYAKEVIQTALHWLKTCTYEAVAELLANHYLAQEKQDIATLTLYFWRRKFGHLSNF
jgi:hypothetical protein